MSNPLNDRLHAGDLEGAIELATRLVDDEPDNDGTRFILFELLTLADRFDDARTQIARLSHDETTNDGITHFAGLMEASAARHDFLVGGRGEVGVIGSSPPEWVGERISALAALATAAPESALAAVRSGRAKHAPPAAVVDGVRCEAFCDADDALAPFIEVLVPGLYLLVTLTSIRTLELAPIGSFPDRIWRPANLTTAEQSGPVWIPGIYAGSGRSDGRVALGQMTTFQYPAEDVRRGAGQRDFTLRNGEETTLRGMEGILRIEIAES